MLVLQRGGWGAGTPVYLEAHLDQPEIDTLRGWVKEAKVSSLADTYPRPLTAFFRRVIGSESSTARLQLRDGAVRTDVTFAVIPGAGLLYPVRLKTLVDRLRAYRPPDLRTFVHDRIEVILTEDDPTAAKGLYPLPAEFSLKGMTEIFPFVDQVRYRKTFTGAKAGRIAARVDAGESVYQDATRSYRIEYRPLLEWPKP